MKTKGLDRDHASAIYDVLVEEVGAPEAIREEFLHYVTQAVEHGHEFRFQGSLGFGGKLHHLRYMPHPYVSCYPEDRTEERADAIAKANRRIEALS